MAAGAIAERLGMASSSMSFHLAALSHAGLVSQRRQSRLIIYTANYAAMNGLMAYLTENCCGGASCLPDVACCPHCCGANRMTLPVDIIYHNPACGTSRNALAMIRNAGIEPHVVEYLKTPPSRAMLESLIARAELARALLRERARLCRTGLAIRH
jgi:hypothetical protein